MGVRATRQLPIPLDARMPVAELIRLCPGCESPMHDAPSSGAFAVLTCRTCGLSVMSPRERRRAPRT